MTKFLAACDDDWTGISTINPRESFSVMFDAIVTDATRDHESAVMAHHADCAGVISWRARVADRVAAYANAASPYAIY